MLVGVGVTNTVRVASTVTYRRASWWFVLCLFNDARVLFALEKELNVWKATPSRGIPPWGPASMGCWRAHMSPDLSPSSRAQWLHISPQKALRWVHFESLKRAHKNAHDGCLRDDVNSLASFAILPGIAYKLSSLQSLQEEKSHQGTPP